MINGKKISALRGSNIIFYLRTFWIVVQIFSRHINNLMVIINEIFWGTLVKLRFYPKHQVCYALTGASGQRCYLCDATTSQFNDIESLKNRRINEAYLQYGISILHAKIRFMECPLRVSKKLTVQRYSVRYYKKTTKLQTKDDISVKALLNMVDKFLL